MFRLTVRDAVWMALLSALLFAWYLEYRSDALARHRDAQAIQYLKQQLSERPQPQAPAPVGELIAEPQLRILPIRSPDGLRPVPGEWDYQFPQELPTQLEPEPLIPWRTSP